MELHDGQTTSDTKTVSGIEVILNSPGSPLIKHIDTQTC